MRTPIYVVIDRTMALRAFWEKLRKSVVSRKASAVRLRSERNCHSISPSVTRSDRPRLQRTRRPCAVGRKAMTAEVSRPQPRPYNKNLPAWRLVLEENVGLCQDLETTGPSARRHEDARSQDPPGGVFYPRWCPMKGPNL